MADSLIGRLVGVTWRDAHADATRQMCQEEIDSARSYIFTSYGILVRDDRGRTDIDDRLVAVAHERGEDGIFRGVTHVPAHMVTDVADLGTLGPRRKRSKKVEAPPTP